MAQQRDYARARADLELPLVGIKERGRCLVALPGLEMVAHHIEQVAGPAFTRKVHQVTMVNVSGGLNDPAPLCMSAKADTGAPMTFVGRQLVCPS